MPSFPQGNYPHWQHLPATPPQTNGRSQVQSGAHINLSYSTVKRSTFAGHNLWANTTLGVYDFNNRKEVTPRNVDIQGATIAQGTTIAGRDNLKNLVIDTVVVKHATSGPDRNRPHIPIDLSSRRVDDISMACGNVGTGNGPNFSSVRGQSYPGGNNHYPMSIPPASTRDAMEEISRESATRQGFIIGGRTTNISGDSHVAGGTIMRGCHVQTVHVSRGPSSQPMHQNPRSPLTRARW